MAPVSDVPYIAGQVVLIGPLNKVNAFVRGKSVFVAKFS